MSLAIKTEFPLITEQDLRDNPLFFEFFENFNSDHTKKSYRTDINQFFDFLASYMQGIRQLKSLQRVHAVAFKKWLVDNEYAPKTTNRKMSAVSSFFDFLVEKNFVEYNIFHSIKRPRQEVQNPTNDLSDEQVQKIIEILESNNSNSALLHRAVVSTLFMTGIRKAELINLKRGDYYYENNIPMIKVKAKGGKMLTKVLPQDCVEAIEDYLSWMKAQNREVEYEDWLFQPTRNPSENNLVKPLNPKSVNYIVKTICKRAGVPQNVSSHSARASYIGSALENGADLYKVSRDVGHSSVKTTEEYDKRRKKFKDSPIHHLGYLKK